MPILQFPTKLKAAAYVIWIWIIGSAIAQGWTLPVFPAISVFSQIGLKIVGLPIVVIISAFFMEGFPCGIPGRWVDRRFGQGTWVSSMKLLKPELLFAIMCLSIGIVGYMRSVQMSAARGAFVVSYFFISGGIAFLIAHFVLRHRGFYLEHSNQLASKAK